MSLCLCLSPFQVLEEVLQEFEVSTCPMSGTSILLLASSHVARYSFATFQVTSHTIDSRGAGSAPLLSMPYHLPYSRLFTRGATFADVFNLPRAGYFH